MLSASLMSLVLPITIFLWAALSTPRPTTRFWNFCILYMEVIPINMCIRFISLKSFDGLGVVFTLSCTCTHPSQSATASKSIASKVACAILAYWRFLLQVIIVVKFLFQFEFFPWNKDAATNLELYNPFWWPRIIGVEQKPNWSAFDLAQLLAFFFHRSILKVSAYNMSWLSVLFCMCFYLHLLSALIKIKDMLHVRPIHMFFININRILYLLL